jgi:hypothetical protein
MGSEQLLQHYIPAVESSGTPPRSPVELYKQLALPPDEKCIRVLDLDAVPLASLRPRQAPLTGSLRVVSLDELPQYAALSYTWGEYSSPRDVVLLNGRIELEITANCRDALLALRRRFGKLTIWVDAICINQADVAERNSQVPLMEDVYAQAESVLAWIGPGDDSSDMALRWLHEASYGSIVHLLVRSRSAFGFSRTYYKIALILAVMGYAVHKYVHFPLRFLQSRSTFSAPRHGWQYINLSCSGLAPARNAILPPKRATRCFA